MLMYNTIKVLLFVWLMLTILLLRQAFFFIKDNNKNNEK